MGSASKAYLIVYNVFQAVGWAVCLAQVSMAYLEGANVAGAYRAGAPAAGARAASPLFVCSASTAEEVRNIDCLLHPHAVP
jgi:hypothetical protein